MLLTTSGDGGENNRQRETCGLGPGNGVAWRGRERGCREGQGPCGHLPGPGDTRWCGAAGRLTSECRGDLGTQTGVSGGSPGLLGATG